MANCQEYKGFYNKNNQNDNINYYEFGAHFSYHQLYKKLEELHKIQSNKLKSQKNIILVLNEHSYRNKSQEYKRRDFQVKKTNSKNISKISNSNICDKHIISRNLKISSTDILIKNTKNIILNYNYHFSKSFNDHLYKSLTLATNLNNTKNKINSKNYENFPNFDGKFHKKNLMKNNRTALKYIILSKKNKTNLSKHKMNSINSLMDINICNNNKYNNISNNSSQFKNKKNIKISSIISKKILNKFMLMNNSHINSASKNISQNSSFQNLNKYSKIKKTECEINNSNINNHNLSKNNYYKEEIISKKNNNTFNVKKKIHKVISTSKFNNNERGKAMNNNNIKLSTNLYKDGNDLNNIKKDNNFYFIDTPKSNNYYDINKLKNNGANSNYFYEDNLPSILNSNDMENQYKKSSVYNLLDDITRKKNQKIRQDSEKMKKIIFNDRRNCHSYKNSIFKHKQIVKRLSNQNNNFSKIENNQEKKNININYINLNKHYSHSNILDNMKNNNVNNKMGDTSSCDINISGIIYLKQSNNGNKNDNTRKSRNHNSKNIRDLQCYYLSYNSNSPNIHSKNIQKYLYNNIQNNNNQEKKSDSPIFNSTSHKVNHRSNSNPKKNIHNLKKFNTKSKSIEKNKKSNEIRNKTNKIPINNKNNDKTKANKIIKIFNGEIKKLAGTRKLTKNNSFHKNPNNKNKDKINENKLDTKLNNLSYKRIISYKATNGSSNISKFKNISINNKKNNKHNTGSTTINSNISSIKNSNMNSYGNLIIKVPSISKRSGRSISSINNNKKI